MPAHLNKTSCACVKSTALTKHLPPQLSQEKCAGRQIIHGPSRLLVLLLKHDIGRYCQTVCSAPCDWMKVSCSWRLHPLCVLLRLLALLLLPSKCCAPLCLKVPPSARHGSLQVRWRSGCVGAIPHDTQLHQRAPVCAASH
jgi:hypothetical protein